MDAALPDAREPRAALRGGPARAVHAPPRPDEARGQLVRFVRVTLEAPADRVDELVQFYGPRIGETALEFVPADGQPFYHFAFLVPGNRFDAALAWARERVELLPDHETGDVVFDFSNWDALACYLHDAAGNIVELIAHHGVEETDAEGEFQWSELVGFSELGLVGDPQALARNLAQLGLEVWDGTLEEPGRLAFVGEKARTLILAPPGRGWLPTGRPAERYGVDVELDVGRYRLARD